MLKLTGLSETKTSKIIHLLKYNGNIIYDCRKIAKKNLSSLISVKINNY